MQPSQILQTAIDAAKAGANEALKLYNKNIAFTLKEDSTPVTIADVNSENTIKSVITKQFPDAQFLAEESGGTRDAEKLWIIDPIDGTRVFTRGIAQWAVLIAYCEKGEVVAGVCYVPTLDILLVAEKGKGTYLNDEKVTVSPTTAVPGSFGSFGSMRHFKDIDPILKLTENNVVLRSYEHAYAMCMLASGKMDVIIDAYAKTWDYAPFVIITQEAGGEITDFNGGKWTLQTREIVATNGILHDMMVKIVNS